MSQEQLLVALTKECQSRLKGVDPQTKRAVDAMLHTASKRIQYLLDARHEKSLEGPEGIVLLACQLIGVPPNQILGRSRSSRLTKKRAMIAAWARNNANLSWKSIAVALGRDNHTTAMAMVNRHDKLMQEDRFYRASANEFFALMSDVNGLS